MRIMSTILTTFAAIIAVGVVYNNARIALAERAWELASLRVLGFTRAEVSALLLGELALVIAIALPLGMLLGWGLTHGDHRADEVGPVLFPGGGPGAHLRLGGAVRRSPPARRARWSCAAASTGSTWCRP